eukprot:scaffold73174_cov56-Phaeocystis_antarctica.AAC.2
MEYGEGPVTMAAVPCWALQVLLRVPLPTPIRGSTEGKANSGRVTNTQVYHPGRNDTKRGRTAQSFTRIATSIKSQRGYDGL